MKRPFTVDRVFRLAVNCLIFYAVVRLFDFLSDVLIPFFVAFLLAYLLNPIVNYLQRKGLRNRLAAVSATLLLVVSLLTVSLWVTIPMLGKEVRHLKDLSAKVLDNNSYIEKFTSKINEELGINADSLGESIKAILGTDEVKEIIGSDNALEVARKATEAFMPRALGFMKGAASLLMGLLGLTVIFLYLVFLLLDYDHVRKGWEKLLPPSIQKPCREFVIEFDTIMNRHFRAQAVVALIVGILFAIAFSMISMPLGILMGLFVGALNMVPYLQIVGLIPTSLLCIMQAVETGGPVSSALIWLLVIFIVIQLIQDALLTPKIMGEVTGLRPAMILLSISIWGQLLGFLGLIIALPATCLFLAYYKRVVLQSQLPEAG